MFYIKSVVIIFFVLILKKRDEIIKLFGEHVKNLRISKSLTQVQVASNMGRDQQSLQRVESGKVNPSLTYMVDLAFALNVSLSELLSFYDQLDLS